MTRPTPRRRLRTLTAGIAVAALLSACTGGDDPDDPTPNGSSGSATTSAEPEGPTSEELSSQILDAADEIGTGSSLGSATGPVFKRGTSGDLTVEVVDLHRVGDEVFLRMLWSTPGEPLGVQPQHLSSGKWRARDFIAELYLDDSTTTQTRYLPMQFDDERGACACPYSPIDVTSTPQVVDAVYRIPPEVTTVSFRAGDTEIVIPDLTIS